MEINFLTERQIAQATRRRENYAKSTAIIKAVSDFYGGLKGCGLSKKLCCHCMRLYTDMSLPEIGRAMGYKDHTTAFVNINRIKHWCDRYDDVKEEVIKVEGIVESVLYGAAV